MRIGSFYILIALLILGCVQNPDAIENTKEHSVVEVDTLNTEENNEVDSVNTDIIEGVAIVKVGKDNDSIEFSISYAYYEAPSLPYMDTINNTIYIFTQDITEFEGQDERGALYSKFFKSQLDSFATIYNEVKELESMIWSLDSEIKIIDNYESFVELHMSSYAFTGGAHGNGYYSIHMVDKENGEILDTEDFFNDIDALDAIAEPLFRDEYGMDDGDGATMDDFWFGEEGFSVNNNFYFKGGMVVFEFNTYEIAPYVMGPTTIRIPVSKIKHLLTRKVD